MILIFTGNEQLDQELNKTLENSRIVYYPDYILEEDEATILISTIQPNVYNFKDFMFKVREKNIRVILLLENEMQKELKEALMLGIYDIIFHQFSMDEIKEKISIPTTFSNISKYIKNLLELEAN